jgi:hypothetical protein
MNKKEQVACDPVKIMEFLVQQNSYQNQNRNGQQQQFNPNQGANNGRYFNQGFNRQYGQNRQYENRPNNYPPKKSNYEQKGNFNKGRSGYKGGNNNNGYSPNGRYQQGNYSGPRDQNQTNVPNIGQKQIQQLLEMLKSIKQQQYSDHTVNGQSTGLGNEGHQPLNSSVVLDVLDSQQ